MDQLKGVRGDIIDKFMAQSEDDDISEEVQTKKIPEGTIIYLVEQPQEKKLETRHLVILSVVLCLMLAFFLVMALLIQQNTIRSPQHLRPPALEQTSATQPASHSSLAHRAH